jgi:hypothetical protein
MDKTQAELIKPDYNPEVNEVLLRLMQINADQYAPVLPRIVDNDPQILTQKIRDFKLFTEEVERLMGKKPLDTEKYLPDYDSQPGTMAAFFTDRTRSLIGESPYRVWEPENTPKITADEMAAFDFKVESMCKVPKMEKPEEEVLSRRLGQRRGFSLRQSVRSAAATVASLIIPK